MKDVKILLGVFAFLISLAVFATKESSEEKPYYECENKFSQYHLDNEPAEYGLAAGYYGPGKKAYIGVTCWNYAALNIARIQLDPPGAVSPSTGGPSMFYNDSQLIWYLRKNRHHQYKWIDSANGDVVPFAINYNKNSSSMTTYIGRIIKDGLVMIGVVGPFMGAMYYVDQDGQSRITKTGYQVLTCRTKRNEPQISPPFLPNPPLSMINTAPVCVHNWQPYKNDNAPAQNGISAGFYNCDNDAYVGKTKSFDLFLPGRIQINPTSGFSFASAGKETFIINGSFYLVDNPNYSYYWVSFDGNFPQNLVLVNQELGRFSIGISRVKINGHVKIGKLIGPVATILNENGVESTYYDFDVLVCDPWPKYKCTQQWKKINANISVDGFSVDSTSFIGRGTRKCINGCDYGLGKIQSGSNGVYYLDDLTATAVFDNSSNVEYLVKNPSDTYKWQPSRNGVKVVNALELHKESHRPFYIGMTRINDNVVVGKVRPGDGLFFIDPVTGKQQSTSSYEVLTCTSPDASNGEYKEESDADWFGSFGCPVRKQWSFIKWRCVCRDEFRGVFAFSGAKWNEETCSYV